MSMPSRSARSSARWVSLTSAYVVRRSSMTRLRIDPSSRRLDGRPRLPWTRPAGPARSNATRSRHSWRTDSPASSAASAIVSSCLMTRVRTHARRCSRDVIVIVVSLNRCNGTDPNGKNGVFVYVQLLATYEADAPGVQFAYDNPANPSYYGDYLRFGYYLCSWSGDSACGLGHGYFVSWSRNDSYAGCAGSDASGIHRLGATTSGFHTFKIDIQSDGSVQFRRDGSLVYTLGSTSTGCWNRSGDVHAAAYSTAWDPGDQIAGSTGSHESVDAFSVNGGSAATTCDFTSIDSYRCADTGSRDIDLWTIDR